MSGHRQQLTRSRVRLRPDLQRVAEALKRPGIDPRTWLQFARIDDDPDAFVWDAELGWLVDVTFVGGELDGEGPVVCRVASMGQGPGATAQHPPRPDCLVVVLVPGGDPNEDCVIVGQLHDETCAAPTQVNGTDITEAFARETHVEAFPGEDLDAEYRSVRLTGEQMVLGAAEADQAFARGDDLADALNALTDALGVMIDFVSTGLAVPLPSPLSPTPVAVSPIGAPLVLQIRAAFTQFQQARNEYLSGRIKGD